MTAREPTFRPARAPAAVLGAVAFALLGLGQASAGPEPPSCHGRPATVLGTAADEDYHYPTDFDDGDVLVLRGGDDDVWGLGRNNAVCGGGGDDWVRTDQGFRISDGFRSLVDGGRGDDQVSKGSTWCGFADGGSSDPPAPRLRLFGGPGSDCLGDAAGNDKIKGGPGRDRVFGNSGRDAIRGGAGADELVGDYGSDWLHGGRGDDYVEGGRGRDHLLGNSGRDFIRAGTGRDLLVGGNGNDRLYGGDGDDYLNGDKRRGTTDEPTRDVADGGRDRDRCMAEVERRCET